MMKYPNELPKKKIGENGIPYRLEGDYYVPDLKLTEDEEDAPPLGKYGWMRRTYLQEHRPGIWTAMCMKETIFPHLREIDRLANERLDQMIPKLAKEAGATEELKASDPMKWVGLMNTCKAQAEEIILQELVYA